MNEETIYNNKSIFQSLAYIECLSYCFYPILSIILITFSSILKVSIDYYAVYTKVNLLVVPALLISAGCIGICCLLSRLYLKKAKHLYLMCFIVFPLLLLFQIIALAYGCVQAVDNRSYLKKAIHRDMGSIFLELYSNKDVEAQINILQNELECCGVYSHLDYKSQEMLPVSCCPVEYLYKYCANATQAYEVGCATRVYEEVTFLIGVLSYVTIALVALQIVGGTFIGRLLFKHSWGRQWNNT